MALGPIEAHSGSDILRNVGSAGSALKLFGFFNLLIQFCVHSLSMVVGPALRREIESTFTVIHSKSTSDELVFVCPECGDKSGHRSLNLRTGKTFCFRCNKGHNNRGHFIGWARALGYQFTSATDVSQVDFADLEAAKPEAFYLPVPRSVALPKGFTLLSEEPKSVYARCIAEMAERKNLSREDFLSAKVGFTREDPLWEPFAIFPVVDGKEVPYYQGRTYVDIPGETTKKFPSRKIIPYGATFWVYNINQLRYTHAPIVLVVESILNVLSLKRKLKELGRKDVVPVAVFKHHVSRYQFARLMACKDVKEICFLFDHDAIDITWRMQLPAIGRRISIAEMPAAPDNKKLDPNDDVDTAMEVFERRAPFVKGTAEHHIIFKEVPGKAPAFRQKLGWTS